MQSRCSAGVKGVDLVRQIGDEGLTGQYACAGRAVKDTSTAAAINITESRIPLSSCSCPGAEVHGTGESGAAQFREVGSGLGRFEQRPSYDRARPAGRSGSDLQSALDLTDHQFDQP